MVADSSTMKLQLANLVRKLSYREGDFLLASGKRSSFYIDLKATTLHPEAANLIGKLAVAKVNDLGLMIAGVGGLTLGADPLATAVSLAAWQEGMFWPAFIVRKDAKDHGTSRYIEGVENIQLGAKLLVLEDVVTTGGSSLKAVERLRESGFDPVAVLAVVDREEGGAKAIADAGMQFISLLTLRDVRESR